MANILIHLLRRVFPWPGPGSARAESQRGLAVFSLAIIGLLFTGMMAGPLLGRTALGLLLRLRDAIGTGVEFHIRNCCDVLRRLLVITRNDEVFQIN